MSAALRPQSAFMTFAIFALVWPAVAALLLFIPNIPAFVRWVSYDSRIWFSLLDSALLIYPVEIWPALVVGAAIAWRDKSGTGTPLIFAIVASLIAGAIWIAVFELVLLDGKRPLLSETSAMRLIAYTAAGIFCWWLSRAKSEAAAA